MAKFWTALKRGIQVAATSLGAGRFTLKGKIISCSHCEHQEFEQGSAQLNTAGMTLMNLDWANRSAATLVCANCGQIQWFLQAPNRVETK